MHPSRILYPGTSNLNPNPQLPPTTVLRCLDLYLYLPPRAPATCPPCRRLVASANKITDPNHRVSLRDSFLFDVLFFILNLFFFIHIFLTQPSRRLPSTRQRLRCCRDANNDVVKPRCVASQCPPETPTPSPSLPLPSSLRSHFPSLPLGAPVRPAFPPLAAPTPSQPAIVSFMQHHHPIRSPSSPRPRPILAVSEIR